MKKSCAVEDVRCTNSPMVAGRVMFGRVVGQIGVTFAPVDVELFLGGAVAKPIKAHVHGFRASLCDRVCKNAFRRLIVKLEGDWSLGMAHFVEGGDNRNGIFCIEKTHACFRFLCGGHYVWYYLAID